MATNPITLLNGTTAYASDVETKVNPLYTSLDPTNCSASALAGVGTKFVTNTGAPIGTPTITTGTYSGNQTFDTTTMFVDATNDVVQFGTVGAIPATFTGVKTYISTSANNCLLLESTSAGSAGPIVYFYANSSTPAAGDNIGDIYFYGKDSGGTDIVEYCRTLYEIADPTNGSEDGRERHDVTVAGTPTSWVIVDASLGTVSFPSVMPVLIGRSTSNAIQATTLDLVSSGNNQANLESTSASATGVVLQTYHNRASPANSDDILRFSHYANDSAGNATEYVRHRSEIADFTNGSEDGRWTVDVMRAGTLTPLFQVDGDNNTVEVAGTAELSLPAVDPPTANMLNQNSGVKAWASFSVTGASTAALGTNYNCTSISASSWNATITIDTDFSTVDYVPCTNIVGGTTADIVKGIPLTAGTCEFDALTDAGVAVVATWLATTAIFGTQ